MSFFRKPAMMLVLKTHEPINDVRAYEYRLLEKPTYLRKPKPKFVRMKRVESQSMFHLRQAG